MYIDPLLIALQFQPYSIDIKGLNSGFVPYDMIVGMSFCEFWFFPLPAMDLIK